MKHDGLRPSERELAEAMEGVRREREPAPRDGSDAPKDGVRRAVATALAVPPGIRAVTIARYADNFDLEIHSRLPGADGTLVGYIVVRMLPRPTKWCAPDFERLAGRLGLPRMARMRVTVSYVDEGWRNRGLGLALYATALREAGLHYGAALGPDACGRDGRTSALARRAWDSETLRSLAEIEGDAFYWADVAPRRVPNPPPSPAVCARRYFHGTPRASWALQILTDGIRPAAATLVKPKSRSALAPQAGRVYLSPSARSALGYGRYLFVVDGAQLCDVEPDEDVAGYAYTAAHEILRQGRSEAEVVGFAAWPDVARALFADADLCRQVLDAGDRWMTARQRTRAVQGHYPSWAAGGKRMVRRMGPQLRLRLVEAGANVAHLGTLRPVEAWTLRPGKAKHDALPDGSNLPKIAVRLRRAALEKLVRSQQGSAL